MTTEPSRAIAVTRHGSVMLGLQKGLDSLALVYIVFYFPVPLFWLLIHSGIGFWRRFGNRSFWIALPVWTLSGVTLVVLRHRIFAERLGRNVATWVVGSALVALGIWVGHRVHRELGLRRLAGLPEMNRSRYPDAMVRSGIYAYVRHPRYLEFMLTFVGLALLTGAKGVFLLAIVSILLYQIVAPLEERELRAHYGLEYEAYARAVARFVPRPWRKAQTQTLP